MKAIFKSLFFCFTTFLLSCSSNQDCPDNANLLPMYGEVKKCNDQIASDNEFISESDKLFNNRATATQYYINKGWEYFYNNNLDTAMMRFNQAWLLDSINADIYWGFGNILGQQGAYKESLKYFDKSLSINSKNANVWQNAANSYGQLFFETKDFSFLEKAIENLKMCISLDSTNALAYGQLTGSYSYFTQKDSARKYLEITDKLDPQAVPPEVRQILSQK